MPPDNRLADDQIEILAQWIRDGAIWPAEEIPEELTAARPEYDRCRRKRCSRNLCLKNALGARVRSNGLFQSKKESDMSISNSVVQARVSEPAHDVADQSPFIDASVREALAGLRNGEVTITVHNGQIVQIDRILKKRQFKTRGR